MRRSRISFRDDIQAAYDQFALALLVGAHENSEWSGGKLVIAGNRANIHPARASVKLEVQ